MPELLRKIILAKLGAEGATDPSEDHVAGSEQQGKNFLAMVEAWFEHHFGITAEEAAAKSAAAGEPAPADPAKDATG